MLALGNETKARLKKPEGKSQGVPFDEMESKDGIRPPYKNISQWIEETGTELLLRRREEAEAIFRKIGITFAVYGEGGDPERLIPFDLVPRAFSSAEWKILDTGIRQRARALNAFLYDIYHRGEIIKAGIIPPELVYENSAYLPEMIGFEPPGRVYSHIVGIDIVRTGPDKFQVLEDNCRTPSGVSYMLENREIMGRMFPQIFSGGPVRPVDHYPNELLRTLREVAPPAVSRDPTVVLLTPGSLNSAYYEHSFLADKVGIELVEGRDLFCSGGRVWMRTTAGPTRVDVIYRRVDDEFIDPQQFRHDSVLGAPGLLLAARLGNVTIANGVGNGVADDKLTYTYLPDLIRYYLGEEPILPNVDTWRLEDPGALEEVLDRLDELVVKPVDGSGGKGLVVGPDASRQELATLRAQLQADPRGWIAQPVVQLSTIPTLVDDGMRPRHADLRPFAVNDGDDVWVLPGGLTRVALPEGQLVVNSSQGGGSKDTWIVGDGPAAPVTATPAHRDAGQLVGEQASGPATGVLNILDLENEEAMAPIGGNGPTVEPAHVAPPLTSAPEDEDADARLQQQQQQQQQASDGGAPC